MNAIDVIKMSLEQSTAWVMELIMDMRDAPTTWTKRAKSRKKPKTFSARLVNAFRRYRCTSSSTAAKSPTPDEPPADRR